ncbi:hypothetical protein Tsubulata_003469 [Turnera subulata]|uniref:Alpha/beta hydrolase fold-3 domain-containing protein n=1 Tax=Turnera subulata TaxID=218843 RepID=A0A9Q0G7R4_9ROSI|nr:hypothetical protein Tsubulata_003469 [Turnera subulata]
MFAPIYMEISTQPEIAKDFSPYLIIYKDGSVQRLMGTDIIPPSLDPNINVHSKDVVYSQEANLSCRLYLPKDTNPDQKLPLLVYFHGGGFCIETPFSPTYHNYLTTLVEQANVIAVSVDYRRAPEHHIPIAYDDSWDGLKWVASHANGDGPEEWLNRHANFSKVFLAGDSAGGNITHQMAIRYGQDKFPGVAVAGMVLIHPFFWGRETIGNEGKEFLKRMMVSALWNFACPTTSGCDDPWINPITDPNFRNVGCNRVLVLVGEKDLLRDRGWYYYENLKKSGWVGDIRIVEAKEEDHVFHLKKPTCENSLTMLKEIVSFFHHDQDMT